MYLDTRPNYNSEVKFELYPGEVVFHVEYGFYPKIVCRGPDVEFHLGKTRFNPVSSYFSLTMPVPAGSWDKVESFEVSGPSPSQPFVRPARMMTCPDGGRWLFLNLNGSWVSLFPVTLGHGDIVSRFDIIE